MTNKQSRALGDGRQPFDMAKLDYEAARHARRRRLLRRSLIPVLAVAAVALWFLLPVPLTHLAIKDYNRKDYNKSHSWLVPLVWVSPQPFVALFDDGTVNTQRHDYVRAEKQLTRALQLAPEDKRCMVLQNLVYALQAHADSLSNDGEAKKAMSYASQASTYMSENKRCFQTIPAPDSKNQGGGGGGGGGGAQAESNQILSATQQEQLQQKNQQGQESQQEDFAPDKADPNSPALRPW